MNSIVDSWIYFSQRLDSSFASCSHNVFIVKRSSSGEDITLHCLPCLSTFFLSEWVLQSLVDFHDLDMFEGQLFSRSSPNFCCPMFPLDYNQAINFREVTLCFSHCIWLSDIWYWFFQLLGVLTLITSSDSVC